MDNSQLENHQLAQLTTALRQQMLKEIRESQPEKSIKSCLGSGSRERFELASVSPKPAVFSKKPRRLDCLSPLTVYHR